MLQNKIKFLKETITSHSPWGKLVVVTKYQDNETTKKAILEGAEIIAESRIQNAIEKKKFLKWLNYSLHLIWHLQTNKVKKAIEIFDMIQSVDSKKLAIALEKELEKQDEIIDILIQLNLTSESQKFWFSRDELHDIIEIIKSDCPHLNLRGLMCMWKSNDTKATKEVFVHLKKLVDDYKLEICSMGMSHDFKLALECGSNMIRVWSYIFSD